MKIGIGGRADVTVMREMRWQHAIKIETSIDQECKSANHSVTRRSPWRKGAVHAIMCYDK